MSLETLKSQLPDYAKDLKLNLSSLWRRRPVLTDQQKRRHVRRQRARRRAMRR